MTAYYNEFDPKAAAWLRVLIDEGHIAPGYVDERSIEDVQPNDLNGFDQCHFFAGIGGWSYALRRANWPDSKRVWTASCPCQPFSAAGKGGGFDDERHLWPAFYHLVGQRCPGRIYGEQVASGDGATWLDLVHTDMETLGYAFGAVAFPSAGVGAPHIRDRTYWLADADMSNEKRFQPVGVSMEPEQKTSGRCFADYWATDEIIRCSDGKARPIKSSIQPLANGLSSRVGLLRGYGNAINVAAASAFITASMC